MIERRKREHVWEYAYKKSWFTFSELCKLSECKVDKTILNSRLSNYFNIYEGRDYDTAFDTVEKCMLPPSYNTFRSRKELKKPNDSWATAMQYFKPGSLAKTVR